MATTTSLLDWILSILRDPDQRAAFQHDPDGYARDHGFGDLSSADVHDALCLIADNQSASYDHDNELQVHYPPPHHYGGGEHAGHYLNNYITNNYKIIDDRDTNVDNSIHQKIDTHGGDFDQHIDNDPVIVSGDHAVGAGHDIDGSTITTGDRNVVGDDNKAVVGDDNTTAFGSGNASTASFDHAKFGDGSAVSVGGDAHGSSEHNSTDTDVHGGHGDTSVNAAGEHGNANQYADQHESDSSHQLDYDEHSRSDSHDESNSHNNVREHDSHDTDSHHA